MPTYDYYLVEWAFVVRVSGDETIAQRYLRGGSWVDYPDVWRVATNGRWLGQDEAQAVREAEELFARDDQWAAEDQAGQAGQADQTGQAGKASP